MKQMIYSSILSFIILSQWCSAGTIADKTSELEKMQGFYNLYWDDKKGRLWLEIDRWGEGFIYVDAVARGIGSNDIGIDRGMLSHENRLVKFIKMGAKVFLIEPNTKYRANSDNPLERLAMEESFAQSVLWGFEVAVEENGRVLVDATTFFLRDSANIVDKLREKKEGNYTLDISRSALYKPRTRNFPFNTEVEAMITFTGREQVDEEKIDKDRRLRTVVPSSNAVTVHTHHSFVKLPEDGYEPLYGDPRAGMVTTSYKDYAAAIGTPMEKILGLRHRLEKKDPTAAVSEAVKPIIYYIDPGAPEPVRSALIEGASWWIEAFEAIGYKNAFQVKILPADVDPMDIRYNVIQWVHRSTRGWSYGSNVHDPRTGEIIKGLVTLGSLRVRQDFLIAQGLLAPYENAAIVPKDMEAMALARVRQLSAHEVGHTLGFMHNYIASAQNGIYGSVLDYPHPYVKIRDDSSLDVSQAYGDKIGIWDKVSVAYAYQDFSAGVDRDEARNKIIMDAAKQGLYYVSDDDARPKAGLHPTAHLWDNGSNAVDELMRVLKIRQIALSNFSERNIPEGAFMATLEEVLVPVYNFHRYQLEAAVKVLGGMDYTYATRGDGQLITEIVSAAEQRRALSALLDSLSAQTLALPKHILPLIPPRPMDYKRHREHFKLRSELNLDPLSIAESTADFSLELILHPARVSRLVDFHARNPDLPGLAEVLQELIKRSWKVHHKDTYQQEVQRVIDQRILQHLIGISVNKKANMQVRAIAFQQLNALEKWLKKELSRRHNQSQKAHFAFALAQIKQFKHAPKDYTPIKAAKMPPGSPIGMACRYYH